MFATRLRRFLTAIRDVAREHGWLQALSFAVRRLASLARRAFQAGGSRLRLPLTRREIRDASAGAPGEPCLAVALTGGLGDTLVIARFMRDLAAAAPTLRFDVFLPRPETSAFVFGSVPGFRHAYHEALFQPLRGEYDLALRANQTVVVYADSIRWNALRDAPALVALIEKLQRSRAEIDDLILHHPIRDNTLARIAVFGGSSRRDFLHAMARLPYGGDRLEIADDPAARERFGLASRAYVTVHNGFDPDFIVTGQRATKCYPHFGRLVAILREARPELVFVQIGTTTSEPIPECGHNLIGRTTVAEAAGLIRGAVAHIDNEGGLVHIAACLGVPSVVLFGPTPSDYFGYPENVNVEPAMCGDCWWLKRSWMSSCVRGYSVPRCLHELTPEAVAAQALHLLSGERGQGTAAESEGNPHSS